jgi:hypothetical protein
VFESVPPFRGIEVLGVADLSDADVEPVRAEIAGRYLGASEGARFAAQRTKPGVLLRLRAEGPRVWDLYGILPA